MLRNSFESAPECVHEGEREREVYMYVPRRLADLKSYLTPLLMCVRLGGTVYNAWKKIFNLKKCVFFWERSSIAPYINVMRIRKNANFLHALYSINYSIIIMDHMLLWLCTEAIVSLKLIIVDNDDWLGNSLPIYSAHCLSKLYSLPGIDYCKCYHGRVHYVPGP